MEFFSNEISNTLQMFTFPMEVVGLTLAAIEVRFAEFAAKIHVYMEYFLDRQEKGLSKGFREGLVEDLIDPDEIEEGARTRYYTLLIIMLLMLLVLLGQVTWNLFVGEYKDFLVVTGLGFSAVFLVYLILQFTRFIVRWVPDRSVGTLGIIIAGFGVLGEAYQFTALMLV